MSSNHKSSVSTQRYLILVKLEGVFGSPSFRKIRSTFKFKWRRDVTEVFFKLFKGAAVPLMQLEPIQLSTNSFETFQARALSLLTSTLLLPSHFSCLKILWHHVCHIFANVSVGVGVMSMVREKYKLAYVGHGADGHNSQWWVHCSPSLTLGTLTG